MTLPIAVRRRATLADGSRRWPAVVAGAASPPDDSPYARPVCGPWQASRPECDHRPATGRDARSARPGSLSTVVVAKMAGRPGPRGPAL